MQAKATILTPSREELNKSLGSRNLISQISEYSAILQMQPRAAALYKCF